ncbi:MAG: DUF2975 domain-containing protein [Salinivirgaceae bacterium]|nr:DUF2975 domain-containing protein [Salinivirgaceae bacterium]
MKGKKLINSLYLFFTGIYYINLVMGMGMIGFEVLNFIQPKKDILASYLGKFKIEINSAFELGQSKVFVESFSGTPSLALEGSYHKYYVFLFVLVLATIAILYSFLVRNLFKELKSSVDKDTLFRNAIERNLSNISIVSFVVFAVLLAMSVLKLVFLKAIEIENILIVPQFDNWILNFLWIGIGFYLLKEIFAVGIQLKKEQDLTI